ncbi:dTDP-4-dehydrorhamnose 3,5-epimerase (plasmid) [Pacificitalea manganoxidans]|uniref:dTDP-4-dehydrorhamnose 3,5-epimerase n=1 Tax=Pacificitalea manganoxidans TaxID=1411902 RepID=A0A291M534_9RHOB|nr:dTDP-4-dehydrorhamnose 3,5-epimerase [Pacificitalea manganoxidans]ATI44029.1 dTDP-4-dehydrorhamnose 3,5-epimerase [Pacificitalea manganoxidans]MDR6310400.1 dTDP-4-dehydrorhamnose 3,5-epimerase [Pacificitalea manganoxidans]
MKITPLEIPAVHLIELEQRQDERGFFARLSCQTELASAGLSGNWLQVNNSLTAQAGVVRGLHFQRPPSAEVKMVRCARGAIFDVAVDLRKKSPTFGQWIGRTLTAENREMLYIPEGFGHGFQSLAPDSEIIYFNTANYAPELEGGVRHDDPDIGIEWPLPISFTSERDNALPTLRNFEPMQLV